MPEMRRNDGEAIALPILNAILQGVKNDVAIRRVMVGVRWTAVISRFSGLLRQVCEELNKNPDDVLKGLAAKGIIAAKDDPLKTIAATYNMRPIELVKLINENGR